MGMLRFFVLFVIIILAGCKRPQDSANVSQGSNPERELHLPSPDYGTRNGNGALISTRIKSWEELNSMVLIQYVEDKPDSTQSNQRKARVHLTYRSGIREVTSSIESGVSESDFRRAKDGNFRDRMMLGFKSPYAVMHRGDLRCVENLGRRRPWIFGKGDVAFYDFAEAMVKHISDEDLRFIPAKDLTEKGCLNTFNHIAAQAFMTAIFSETLADFVADVHERYTMPELVTGRFTPEQLTDLENGPVDNYIDILNNEWGQELGKVLQKKYAINRKTKWTPELLANFMNDIQSYHSWALQIGFKPFRATDEMVIQFAGKINRLLTGS